MTLRHARLTFPVHPRTGLTAIGHGRRGPIWPVMGGAPDEGEGGTDDDPEEGESDDGDDKPERTFTQAEVDRLIAQRLHERKNKYSDYDELKAKAAKYDDLAEEQKSETQRLTERAEKAEREAKEARTGLLRERIAVEKKLPAGLAARLHGDTEEEIKADADELLASLGEGEKDLKQKSGPPDMDQGPRGKGDKGTVASGMELFEQRHKQKTPA
jgi:hypothetical protein